MADATGISWADATFNPWIGCAKVSPACAHCYAEDFAENRMGLRDRTAEGGEDFSVWGVGARRKVTADSTWKNPLRWARLAREGRLPNGDENRDGHRPRVFCASMADVFEPRYDLERPRERLFELIADTPELDWMILTKRPEIAKTYLVDGRQASPDEVDDGYELGWVPPLYYDGQASARRILGPVPLPNVWLGVSIENARFTWRAEVLREIPAAVRFISAEPLLASLYETASTRSSRRAGATQPAALVDGMTDASEGVSRETGRTRAPLDLTGIDWVIVGGESGGRESRPTHPDWAREIRDACVEDGVAFHMKQWGSHAPVRKTDPHGGDLWLYPDGHTEIWQAGDSTDRDAAGFLIDGGGSNAYLVRYAGAAPKSGGKMLDGVDWCEFPKEAVPA